MKRTLKKQREYDQQKQRIFTKISHVSLCSGTENTKLPQIVQVENLTQNPIQNFEAVEELFYWDLTFYLLGTHVPKYLHFHDDGNGDLEQCTDKHTILHY